MGTPLVAAIQTVDAVLERLFGSAPLDVTSAARGRADAFASIAPGGPGSAVATLVYAGELVAAHVLERDGIEGEVRELVAETARITTFDEAVADAAIFSAALRSRTVFELPPRVAAEVAVKLLNTFAQISETSLWVQRDVGAAECTVVVGADTPSRRVRRLALDVLATPTAAVRPGVLQAVPVMQWDRPQGVLVIRTRAEERARALGYAREVAFGLVPILEKETLLDRNEARTGALTGASERRLVRLGFDLHDGPLQDVAALAVDLRLFKRQLGDAAVDGPAAILAGRVDDLVARVVATERGLRELAKSLESPTVVRAPLRELMQQQVDRLRSESGIDVSFAFRGRAGEFTASQRIALVRFVEEAFTNVRDHSGASRVGLTVTIGRANLRAVVEDDGRGFEVERTLVQSARAGHLGLVGMGERMRLLGGRLDVQSAPGGPTIVTATIPRWDPPAGA